jgi:hypothetical protein
MGCSNSCLAVFWAIWAADFMQKGSPCLGLPWKLSIRKSTVQCIVERDPQHWNAMGWLRITLSIAHCPMASFEG